MRIGVLSDTHGDISIALKALKKMGKIDLLIHAGDHYDDAINISKKAGVEVVAVAGNCDYTVKIPQEKLFEIEEYKIFLTHGHKYGVKSGIQSLYYRGLELEADIVIFGHTHVPLYFKEENIHLLNPGSIARPRGISKPSFAIIECGKKLDIKIKDLVN